MLWPGMRFSLRSQCKRCSAGRLLREHGRETNTEQPGSKHTPLLYTAPITEHFRIQAIVTDRRLYLVTKRSKKRQQHLLITKGLKNTEGVLSNHQVKRLCEVNEANAK